MLRRVLDGAHKSALRAVANGSAGEEHAAAVRNLATAGLVAPVDGAWSLTQAGHAVLELEGAGRGVATTGGGVGGGAAGIDDLKAKIRDWFMN
jgi:hypothetical protein